MKCKQTKKSIKDSSLNLFAETKIIYKTRMASKEEDGNGRTRSSLRGGIESLYFSKACVCVVQIAQIHMNAVGHKSDAI